MKIKLGKFVLRTMGANAYNKKYDANVQEQYGKNIRHIVWLEQYNKQGELVAMSEDCMLIFKNCTFAYTSRHAYFEANIFECFNVIKYMEAI